VVRPAGFDLAEAWSMITDEVDRKANAVHARGLAAPDAVGLLRMIFGDRVSIGPATADGRIEVDLSAAHVHALAGELAGVGKRVEVLEPPELRERLAAIGAELGELYPV
jgi:predicted DNA-binding transcriptional regulator YafY